MCTSIPWDAACSHSQPSIKVAACQQRQTHIDPRPTAASYARDDVQRVYSAWWTGVLMASLTQAVASVMVLLLQSRSTSTTATEAGLIDICAACKTAALYFMFNLVQQRSTVSPPVACCTLASFASLLVIYKTVPCTLVIPLAAAAAAAVLRLHPDRSCHCCLCR